MDWQTIALGLSAVLTGAGGCALVIHELRRRDRRALRDEVEALSVDVMGLRRDLVICRRYAFDLADVMARHGLEVPPAPEVHTP